METFMRFAHINTASLSVAITLALVFGYLGYRANGDTKQVLKVLWCSWLVPSTISLVGKYQGWW